jgi:hypothetical protein
MKDARGHGSNGLGNNASVRADYNRNKVGMHAQFSAQPRPMPKMTTDDHVADLRNRLSAPKPGLVHSFMQGVRNAMGYST